MPFSNLIDRGDAQALMPEEVQREIVKNVPEASAVMRMARRLPNMSRKQRRLPVLATLAQAWNKKRRRVYRVPSQDLVKRRHRLQQLICCGASD